MSADHSHHASLACIDCHIPRTSYALFSAIRSHRIESPRVSSARLPACNLCHLDRTLAWTQEKLAVWYGQKPIALAEERVPAAVSWALAGDAAERALAADAMGRADALRASGSEWEGTILDALTRDPYAAVRFIAEKSRRAVGSLGPGPGRTKPVDLVPADAMRAEIARRDDRPVTIAE
jgi:hypothetical protein